MTNSTSKLIGVASGFITAAFVAAEVLKSFRKISLRNKTVLIMGGSRGLGLELARVCLERGAKLALAARDLAELERAKEILANESLNQFISVETHACDVTHEDEVQNVVRQVTEKLGAIDVLINNEGVIESGPENYQTHDDYTVSMNTHFWGPLYAIKSVLPQMKERHFGRIINIASIAGLISVPHLIPYCASKHALVGLSEGYRTELLKDNIYVTTVCPGLMRTGSPRNADFKGANKVEYALFSLLDALPLTSVDSRQAATMIVRAAERGDAQLVISLQAQAVKMIHAAAPEMVTDLFGLTNAFLPNAGGVGSKTAKGKDSESFLVPSFLTKLSDEAAARNNELSD